MSTEKPLECIVRPRGPAFATKFAQDLVSLFVGSDRIDATATSQGIVVRCLWERDLEWAAERIKGVFPGELLWTEPRVIYRAEVICGVSVVMEPMLMVHTTTPEDNAGTVMGELSRRRGMITGMDDVLDQKVIHAQVPLAEMAGYCSWHADASKGKGSAVADFDSYQEAPRGRGPDPNEPVSAALRA